MREKLQSMKDKRNENHDERGIVERIKIKMKEEIAIEKDSLKEGVKSIKTLKLEVNRVHTR